MRLNAGSVSIKKLIIHEVPNKRGISGNTALVLSERESILDKDSMRIFQEKIILASSGAFSVQFDETTESKAPPLIRSILKDKNQESFIKYSAQLANELYETQTGQVSGGILVVIAFTNDTKNAVAILKLEKEDGVRLLQDQVEGKTTFNLDYVKNLLITKKTRVFKTGIFVADKVVEGKLEIVGYVTDPQNTSNTDVADFFLAKFLGCKLTIVPEVATRIFFEATNTFINNFITEPDEKIKAYSHLVSELTNNKRKISIPEFAENYLDAKYQQKYVSTMKGASVPRHIEKNTNLIDNKIKKITYLFESGISLIGTNEVLSEKVVLKSQDKGTTKVEFVDKITKIKS